MNQHSTHAVDLHAERPYAARQFVVHQLALQPLYAVLLLSVTNLVLKLAHSRADQRLSTSKSSAKRDLSTPRISKT